MFRNFILPILLSVMTVPVSAQWGYLGLGGRQCNGLASYGDTLYASTDAGLFKKSMLATDTIWMQAGMGNFNVLHTSVKDHQSILGVVALSATDSRLVLYRSLNGGQSYNQIPLPPSSTYSPPGLNNMVAVSDAHNDTLYFLHHNMKTYDFGSSFIPIMPQTMGVNSKFIAVNPFYTSQVFIGGEDFGYQAYLQRSNDRGNSFNLFNQQILPGDNAIHDMCFTGDSSYFACEGLITKSSLSGNPMAMDVLFDHNNYSENFALYFTNIQKSKVNAACLYATGFTLTDNHLVPLIMSNDHGNIWDTLTFNVSVANPLISSLLVSRINNKDYVFLGGRGVYVYRRNVPSSVTPIISSANTTIFPNPCSDVLRISGGSGPVNCTIINAEGKRFPCFCRDNVVNVSSLAPGNYIIRLVNAKKEVVIREFKKI